MKKIILLFPVIAIFLFLITGCVKKQISYQEQVELDLIKNQNRLALSLDKIGWALITIDDKFQLTHLNTQAERLFECELAQIMGLPAENLLPEVWDEIPNFSNISTGA
jgi:PAS domain-containing protein